MKKFITVISIFTVASMLLCACGKKANEAESESGGTNAPAATQNTTGEVPHTTAPTEPPVIGDGGNEEVDVNQFVDQNFNYTEDDGYEYKEQVGGSEVFEYGVYDEDGNSQSYTPGTPNAPTHSGPLPSEPDEKPVEPDPKPSEPDEKPVEPDPKPSEPDEKPVEPDPPTDVYNLAISQIDDYKANVVFMCELELSDGSVSKYKYTYHVEKNGDKYTADYKESGKDKQATFDRASGVMTVDGEERQDGSMEKFYRFCSMVEPFTLKQYFYERSEAGVSVSARPNGNDYRSLLLNVSSLFAGFETMESVKTHKVYYNGFINADGRYTSTDLAYNINLTDQILGEVEIRVAVEVDYVL